MEPLLAPEAVHTLVVYQPAFPPEQAIRHPPTPADVLSCELTEAPPQLGLLNVDNLDGMSLSAAVLTHHFSRSEKALKSNKEEDPLCKGLILLYQKC